MKLSYRVDRDSRKSCSPPLNLVSSIALNQSISNLHSLLCVLPSQLLLRNSVEMPGGSPTSFLITGADRGKDFAVFPSPLKTKVSILTTSRHWPRSRRNLPLSTFHHRRSRSMWSQLSLLTEAFLAPQRPLQQTTGGEDRQQISSRPRQCREPNQKPRSQCSRPRHRQRRHLQRPLSSRYRRPRRCKGTYRRGWVWTAIPLPGHAPTLAEEPGSQVRGDWKLIGQYWRYGSASDSRHSVWNQQGRSTLDRPKDPLWAPGAGSFGRRSRVISPGFPQIQCHRPHHGRIQFEWLTRSMYQTRKDRYGQC